MLYEWAAFEFIPTTLMFPLKTVLPLLLLFFPIKKVIKDHAYYNNFILCYFLFVLWSLVPSIFGGNPEESITQWLKFISRFLFFLLASLYLITNKEAQKILMKAFVFTGLFSFIQYLMVWFFNITGLFSFNTFFSELPMGVFYGPFGLLGEVGSSMEFPGLGVIYRFHGFWAEPSKASGFMFAAYFLAKNLFYLEQKTFWKKCSYVCLLGGFLCFSNAGYLAIAMSLLFGLIMSFMSREQSIFNISIKLGTIFLLVFLALFGRTYVTNNYIDIEIARAIVGVRGGSCAGTSCGGVDYSVDPTDGRLSGYYNNLRVSSENPLGIGIRITGKFDRATGYRSSAGNALIEWLIYTGYIGLFLLLLRELQVILFTFKYKHEGMSVIYLTQAWIAFFIQNLLYGTIMTPAYLIVIGLIFACKKIQIKE